MTELIEEYREWRREQDLPWNPNFVPKVFDGMADLENRYWRAEQKATAFEQDRDWKKAIETKALPPARPRKAKNDPSLDMFEQLGKLTAKAIADAVKPLQARIAELEARPLGLDYKGVWKPDYAYAKNHGVTHMGSIWVALRDKPTKEPGEPNSNWQLACKRGVDGKDLRK